MCQPRSVTQVPVCVLGLGLIGGSLLRAGRAAGRTMFGYNRSPDGVEAARADGYDASADLTAVLQRAAGSGALIVLAVPVPALPTLLSHIVAIAPDCPLTDVVSVKAAVHDQVRAAGLLNRFVGGHPMTGTAHSGWSAGDAALFRDAAWVISVDDHVDPQVWSLVLHLALECGAFVVPARSDEHDAAAAAISHLPHLAAEELVRAMCEANATDLTVMLDRAIELLTTARAGLADDGSVAELVAAGHAARIGYESYSRPDIVAVTPGAPGWRTELAAAGRSGGVIRSALPGPDSRR